MKSRIILGAITLLVVTSALFIWTQAQSEPGLRRMVMANADRMPAADSTAFAVLELFTSEGCSSCPPADRILGEIAADARRSGARIIPLAFHVDYWNRLGWTDPFSNHAFTERQYAYAGVLNLESVYTPQLIVNGRQEFVGSNAGTASEAIHKAMSQAAGARVALAVTPGTDASSLHVEYTVSDENASHDVLNIALVERGLVTNVPSGENAGRTLHHDNVVRTFQTIPLGNEPHGTLTIAIPAGVEQLNSSIVAYVQDPATMVIRGAMMSDIGRGL